MNIKEIINSNKEKVKNIIKTITGEQNEDLEQEVYLRVWKNSDKYQEQGKISGWISKITQNITKDYLKSACVKHETLTTEDDSILYSLKDNKETPELKTLNTERQKRITNAINNLKPKFKEVIIYCEVYNHTYEEAAAKYKCPIGTIKSRLYNAKKQLAEDLKDLI